MNCVTETGDCWYDPDDHADFLATCSFRHITSQKDSPYATLRQLLVVFQAEGSSFFQQVAVGNVEVCFQQLCAVPHHVCLAAWLPSVVQGPPPGEQGTNERNGVSDGMEPEGKEGSDEEGSQAPPLGEKQARYVGVAGAALDSDHHVEGEEEEEGQKMGITDDGDDRVGAEGRGGGRQHTDEDAGTTTQGRAAGIDERDLLLLDLQEEIEADSDSSYGEKVPIGMRGTMLRRLLCVLLHCDPDFFWPRDAVQRLLDVLCDSASAEIQLTLSRAERFEFVRCAAMYDMAMEFMGFPLN